MIFGIINALDINDNKTFWKTVKPAFTKQTTGMILSQNKIVTKIFPRYWLIWSQTLKYPKNIDFETEFINPVLNALTKKIEIQPIIMMIENKNNKGNLVRNVLFINST